MRHISFLLTTAQFRDRSKTVTRRDGWVHAKAGDVVMGCERCQGLQKGQSVPRLSPVRWLNVRREPLEAIDKTEVIAEGFPNLSPAEFVDVFMAGHKDVEPASTITRLEYEYLCAADIGDRCVTCDGAGVVRAFVEDGVDVFAAVELDRFSGLSLLFEVSEIQRLTPQIG